MEAHNQFTDLLDKYMRQVITPEELNTLNHQKRESPARQRAFERLTEASLFEQDRRLLAQADAEAAWQRFATAHPELMRPKPARRVIKGRLAIASAAAALLLAVGIYRWQQKDNKDASHIAVLEIPGEAPLPLHKARDGRLAGAGGMEVFKTAHALELRYKPWTATRWQHQPCVLKVPDRETWKITLGDGSVVWMDSASVLTFPAQFTGSRREVAITGACYFEIKKDPLHPFIVRLGADAWVEVTGTRFTVEVFDKASPRVALLEGEVRVQQGSEVLTLQPGEQAWLTPQKIQRTTGILPEQEYRVNQLRNFYFGGQDIQQVLTELAAWYQKKLILQGRFDRQPFSASFPRDAALNTILGSLQNMHALHYAETKDTLLVTGLCQP